MSVNVHVDCSGACPVLRVAGDLRFWTNERDELALREAFKTQLPKSANSLILNLAGVHHLDTRGIQTLVQVLVECGRANIELSVVMPTGVPGQALTAVRIFDARPRFQDEASALAATA